MTSPAPTPAFEHITRQMRWLIVAVIVVTFPPYEPQASWIYLAALLTAAYNGLRYLPGPLRWRWFSSPATVIGFDCMLGAILLGLVGRLDTPYTAVLIFMLISAAYRYGLAGAVTLAGVETAILGVAPAYSRFGPIDMDQTRVLSLAALLLVIIGVLIERLTHTERQEHVALEHMSRDNETERNRLFTLVNSLNDAIFVLDRQGLIVEHNGAAQALVASHHDLHGQKLAQVLPLHPRNNPDRQVDVLWAESVAQRRRDLQLANDEGGQTDLDITVMPVQSPGEAGSEFIVVCRDITKERSLDEQRKEFISVASHELRTPLAIVEAALSTALMKPKELRPETVALIEQAHHNTMFLGELVKDLTTLSRAQNDSLPVHLGPVSARAVFKQLSADFKPDNPKLKLATRVAAGTPVVLSTEQHVREILSNYVSNAVKYSPQGGTITLKAEPDGHRGILFSVKDQGIGIAASGRKHLFTKFYRAEDYRTRETGGTGLGLYLCLELAQRLNGKVWCHSKLNHGSTFYLQVPPFSQLEQDRDKVAEAQMAHLLDQL